MRFGDASPVRAVSFGNIPVEAMRPSMITAEAMFQHLAEGSSALTVTEPPMLMATEPQSAQAGVRVQVVCVKSAGRDLPRQTWQWAGPRAARTMDRGAGKAFS